jgi:glycosyltransferase involved in cell wall biosynthesis
VTPPSLSIVIPAFNESTRLAATLATLSARVGDVDAEIIVVDDGSRDDTAAVARRLLADAPPSRVIELPENRGKGAAVRAGVAAATGLRVLFMDADLATDLAALDTVLPALDDADIAIGSRAVPGAVVLNATRGREVMGRVFNRMVRVLARLPVHDTQCGFKAFRGPVAKRLFGMSRIDGFAFDAEVLVYARALGMRIVELPVTWTAVDGSSVRPFSDSVATALQLARVVVRSRPSRIRAAAAEHEPAAPAERCPQSAG